MIYHVSKSGNDNNTGSEEFPFLTISKAASVAVSGDTVLIHKGTYREWVRPAKGGTADSNRIIYTGAPGEKVIIKGSEIIESWDKISDTVYKTSIPNSLFGDYNPYKETLDGDWFRLPENYPVHSGDVYINGISMYEAKSMEDLFSDEQRTEGYAIDYPTVYPIDNPESTLYRWFSVTDNKNTVIFANFRDIDPNEATIEVNVRKCCFFPNKTGVDYITVRGIEFAHAATPFAPPTATQYGAVGPNWSKGWIIENNIIHDSKCIGISVGNYTAKENLSKIYCKKSAHQYQIEAIYDGLRNGWNKDCIGSHLIRNNTIYNCGQAGIAGNLGGAFSTIEHNHIYNISSKQEFSGHELGGIKLHAAIDTIIKNNYIHNCVCWGIWLDWQAQGTRVTRNFSYNNKCDLMIEVTHGPCTVDNNLFMSDYSLINFAEGTAYVNNIFAGYAFHDNVKNRETPYHLPHSTEPLGYSNIVGGDDRAFGNIYLGNTKSDLPDIISPFNKFYDKYLTKDEYDFKISSYNNLYIDHSDFTELANPVYINYNVYAKNSDPFCKENNSCTTTDIPFVISEENGKIFLSFFIPDDVADFKIPAVTTTMLGTPRIIEQPYTNPDGGDIDFTCDYLNNHRVNTMSAPGPFSDIVKGGNKFQVWNLSDTGICD